MQNENINLDGVVKYENSGISLDTNEVVKTPIFFLPFKEKIKGISTDQEPYTDVVNNYLNEYLKLNNKCKNAYANATNIYLQKFISITTSNINIILNNGLFHIMNNFSTNGYPVIRDLNDIVPPHISGEITYAISNLVYDLMDNKVSLQSAIVEAQTIYSSKLSKWVYEIINESLNKGLININEYGKSISRENGIVINENVDGSTDVDNSFYSLCLTTLLEFANRDIYYIMDAVEMGFVHLVYNLFDLKMLYSKNFIEDQK